MATLTKFDSRTMHRTPRGEAIWPKLVVPETKFDKCGVYETRVKFSPEDEKTFLAQMEALRQEAYECRLEAEDVDELEQDAPPWRQGKDGRYEFKFKLRASGFDNGKSWEDAPKLWDARGEVFTPDPAKFKLDSGSI